MAMHQVVSRSNLNQYLWKNFKTNENDSFTIIKKTWTEIDRYWTEERMAKAQFHPSPKVSKKMLARLKKKINVTGIVESVEGRMSIKECRNKAPNRANVKKAVLEWRKIFFTKPNGEDYVGSAQFAGTPTSCSLHHRIPWQ